MNAPTQSPTPTSACSSNPNARQLGRLVIISGPSGSGKSTLAQRMANDASLNAKLSISATTRTIRPGEQEGRDYFFLTRDQFIAKRDRGEFLEHAEVHGNLYGTPASWVSRQLQQGHNVILEIDVKGALQAKLLVPSALLVFIHVGTLEKLEQRLRGRETDDEPTVQRRLRNAIQELDSAHLYDVQLLNDDLERAVQELAQVFASHCPR